MNVERYYYFSYSKVFGWRSSGKTEGYETLEELKQDNSFDMERHHYQITKSKVVESHIKEV